MRIILSLLFMLFIPFTVQADVITQDPNTAGSQQTPTLTQTTDPRLTQKITCTLGYTRLHTVVEELSKLSGVTIRCGKNNDDWRVRDIPVVVWVKELPLGKALEAVAAASHTQLSSSRMDDIITYRISSRLERQIEDYEKEKQKAVIEGLKWDWDTAVKLKDVPDSAYAPGEDEKNRTMFSRICASEQTAYVRAVGAVLALLGPETRDNIILSGNDFVVQSDEASPALESALMVLGRAAVEQSKSMMVGQVIGSFGDPAPSSTELSKVSLSFRCRKNNVNPSQLDININMQGESGPSSRSYHNDLGRYIGLLAQFVTGTDLGKRPTVPEPPTDALPVGYKELSKEDEGDDPQQLQKIVILVDPNGSTSNPLPVGVVGPVAKWTPPTNGNDLTTADALVELARTSGFSVISEDFQSHLDAGMPAIMFGKERSAAYLLRTFNRLATTPDGTPFGGRDWFVDEKNSLILGQSMDWVRQHRDLVPERLIAGLTNKLNGDGVMLDDVIPVLGLSKGRISEWFTMSRELQPLRNMVFHLTDENYGSWWRLQSTLSSDQKTAAESKEGLPLSLVDPAEAVRALDGCKMGKTIAERAFGSVDAIDPQEFAYFTFHCRKQRGKQLMQGMFSIRLDGQPSLEEQSAAIMSQIDSVDWHTWQITLDYDKGDTHTGSFSALGPFPVFSPKRLAELKEQAPKAQPK